MSTTQSQTLTINNTNATSVFTATSGIDMPYEGTIMGDGAMGTNSTSIKKTAINSTGKDILFPNSVAKPIKADVSYRMARGPLVGSPVVQVAFYVNDTEICTDKNSSSSFNTYTHDGITNSAITAATKNSTLECGIRTSNISSKAYMQWISITFYFTQYEFSATAGTNISSVSVSSSTGYDGDSITYSCVLASGAVFDGWYNGSTRVSTEQTYTITVNGADVSLEARATMPVITKTLSATYNGAQIQSFPISVTSAVALTYNGTSKGSIPIAGGTKTFQCNGQIASGNITIGEKTLPCANKVMLSNIVVIVS